MEPYKILQKMIFSKRVNETVRRAVRSRLERFLADEEKAYKFWQDMVAHKLRPTQKRDTKRKFEKIITSYKIIIFHLTPISERLEEPPLVNRKMNKDED